MLDTTNLVVSELLFKFCIEEKLCIIDADKQKIKKKKIFAKYCHHEKFCVRMFKRVLKK